ncbi:sodium- and chloride-dependent glycine transporter 1-like [Haliotis asinina]|uniref:sodium- and chloride-dependent glycine transporter 1-like n=1 Tax=Haliotis asinina TaxID=109174 RepID=UPI0035321059
MKSGRKGDFDGMDSSSSTGSTNSVEKMKRNLDNQGREGWSGKLDFILTCIGYAVGLGNIWRFPYLCYKSGGGAFFIPYVIFLILCGIPLFFMEVTYGQFSSLSPVAIWRICPLFKGVGIGMVIVSGIVCVYYNVIVGYTVYYLFMSFRATLPWSNCNNEWNTDNCVDSKNYGNTSTIRNYIITNCLDGNTTHMPSELSGLTNDNSTEYYVHQTFFGPGKLCANQSITDLMESLNSSDKSMSASEQFWEHHVLEMTDGIEDIGTLRWQLLISLIVAWLCVFFCLFKGVKVLGKVMHFAAPFPYLVLMVLLIRGVTLPGAIEGIKYYIIPRFEKLANFQVWGDAALQIFYSVGMAWGGIITMASYNKFSHNVYRDAMIVPLINCGTSIFAGFVIFSVLGFMAHEAGTTMEKVVTQGPGLTFVAYPEAIAKLPISPLWAVLFFLMLFTIGLDSQFGMFETMLSGVIDEYPKYLRNKKVLVTAACCFFEFIIGLPLITQGGIYILQIMDWYCASFSLMLISLTECLAISWCYGTDRFCKDIELMIGRQPHRYWQYMWKFVTPSVIVFIWLFSVITLGPVTYGDKVYPQWAIIVGWSLGVTSVLPIPIMMVFQLYKTEGTLLERFQKLTKPAPEWGPALTENRLRYYESLGLDDPLSVQSVLPSNEVSHDSKSPEHLPEQFALLPQSEKA